MKEAATVTFDVPEQEQRAAVEAATLAPSLHNSQPWSFAIDPQGLDVYADRSRNPDVVDRTGRELHIGCGAATMFARLALRSLGWDVSTQLLPDSGDTDHLARLTVTGRREATDEERLLVDALPIRYTDRGRYAEQPIPTEVIDELRAATEAEGAWLRPLDRPADLPLVATVLAHADELERGNPAYVEELEKWSRFDETAPDGVPRSAVDPTPVTERGSSYRLRDFDVDSSVTAGFEHSDGPPVAEHPLVVVVGTGQDDPRSWLEAGMAVGHLLLQATARGISAAPMTQVLEVPTARLQLGHGIGAIGHPQMLLRLGYGGTGHPTTHRRPVDEVLR
ncbi:MAG: Acg family FMN-binding oxidoreductase [Actinomycetes bacterium]